MHFPSPPGPRQALIKKKGAPYSSQVVNKTSVTPWKSRLLSLYTRGPRHWATQSVFTTHYCMCPHLPAVFVYRVSWPGKGDIKMGAHGCLHPKSCALFAPLLVISQQFRSQWITWSPILCMDLPACQRP